MAEITIRMDGLELVLLFDYQPFEPITREYPGAAESVEVYEVRFSDCDVTPIFKHFYGDDLEGLNSIALEELRDAREYEEECRAEARYEELCEARAFPAGSIMGEVEDLASAAQRLSVYRRD